MKGIKEFVKILTLEEFMVGIELLHSATFSVTGSHGIYVTSTYRHRPTGAH